MIPERRLQAGAIFQAAVSREPDTREAFLTEACLNDPELRAEVDAMLTSHRDPAPGRAPPDGTWTVSGVLSPGTRMGIYQVEALIGRGGMGEVYRARDTTLGRDVAIKIFRSGWLNDADHRLRFDREARLLASLNHPNIGAIYGLTGADSVPGLVLELVDGETLAERLRPHGHSRRGLPLVDALSIARQIALALEAAHDKGIVHRDLKPANIKITSTGVVKVLDFGLAKIPGEASAPQADAPTVTTAGTQEGLVIGTVAYMSPEQARGKPVDKRTDTWAFGCVLYEMLTGRLAFAGETVSDTLAAVIERSVDWGSLSASTPASIRTLLHRCLEKDPARRLRDIGDARLELEDAMASPAAPPVSPAGTKRMLRARDLALISAALVIVAVALLWPRSPGREGVAARPSQMIRLTFDAGLQTDPALQPGGRLIAYSSNVGGNFDIYVQPVDGGNAVPVTRNDAHDWQPDWSVKDQIVFRSERDGGGLYIVPQTGGHEQQIASFGHRPLWSPDGSRIVFLSSRRSYGRRLYVVGLDGAAPRECARCGVPPAFGWYPDGLRLSLFSTDPAPQLTPHLRLVDVDQGTTEQWQVSPEVDASFREQRVAVLAEEPVRWKADASAFYFIGISSGVAATWRMDVTPDMRVVSGGPHRVTTMGERNSGLTISRTGDVVAFGAAVGNPQVWSFPLDAAGRITAPRPESLTPGEVEVVNPSLARNGATLVYSVVRPGGTDSVELQKRTMSNGNTETLLVSHRASGEGRNQPQVSPDGERVVFRYTPPDGGGTWGRQQMRLVDLNNGKKESPLTSLADGAEVPFGWSSDSRFVVATFEPKRYQPGQPGMAIGLFPVSAAPTADKQLIVVTAGDDDQTRLFQASMSPDDRWVTFLVQNPETRNRIAVVGPNVTWTTPRSESDWKYIDADQSVNVDKPRWSADGRLIYFLSERGGLWNVWAVAFDPATGPKGPPMPITRFDSPGEQIPSQMGTVEISVANGRLVIPTIRPTGGIWMLRVNR